MDARTEVFVRERASYACEYCGLHENVSLVSFHIEHVVARQHGGGDEPENLALACPECNRRKGPNIATIDPLSGELARLFNPRKDRWSDHFQTTAGTIEGRTAVGRGTTALLNFNAKGRVRLRQLAQRVNRGTNR
jgi:hypothetical protein